jgi:predicted nucleic acid-binding protein
MKYLLDANVLSEVTRARPSLDVVDWLRDHDHALAVNTVILGELEYGILLLPAGKRRTRLEQWFHGGLRRLEIFVMDADTAAVWARLLLDLRRRGREMPVKDSLIAATARQHGLTVATRNTRHFEHAGVKLVNPFTS